MTFGEQVRLTLCSFPLELIPVFALKSKLRIIANVTQQQKTPTFAVIEVRTASLILTGIGAIKGAPRIVGVRLA